MYVTKDDLRNKRMSRRAGNLTVFLVDASGSMALHRMAAAKTAALRLVAESHTKRDSVALVSIAGDAASVLLPPTRSILAANRRLAELPCGGGTPLAHGLVVAARVAVNAAKTKGGAGDARVVLITDGGANIGLDRSQQAPRVRAHPSTAARTSVSIGRCWWWTRVRSWAARGGRERCPRQGRGARGGGEVSQDADGRGSARERRGALRVGVAVREEGGVLSFFIFFRLPDAWESVS